MFSAFLCQRTSLPSKRATDEISGHSVDFKRDLKPGFGILNRPWYFSGNLITQILPMFQIFLAQSVELEKRGEKLVLANPVPG